MKKSIFSISLMAMTLAANAQISKNIEYDCVVKNMKYVEPVQQKKSTAGTIASVAGTILSAIAGDAKATTHHPEYAENVMQAIKSGIGSTYRLNMVDNTPNSTERVLNINATISAISTTQRTHVWTDNQKKSHSDLEYSANITGTVSLTDACTGNIVWQTTINRGGLSYGWMTSAESALGDAVAYVQKSITDDLNEEFPLYASIVEAGKVTKNKQKEVYINLGEDTGVSKGMKFYVYQVLTINGKEAKKEIGRVKVTEVMGDDISNCKVIKGASDIKTALEEGKTLQIMSRG